MLLTRLYLRYDRVIASTMLILMGLLLLQFCTMSMAASSKVTEPGTVAKQLGQTESHNNASHLCCDSPVEHGTEQAPACPDCDAEQSAATPKLSLLPPLFALAYLVSNSPPLNTAVQYSLQTAQQQVIKLSLPDIFLRQLCFLE